MPARMTKSRKLPDQLLRANCPRVVQADRRTLRQNIYARQRNVRACIFRLSTVYARPSDGNESGFVTHYVESVKRGWPIRVPLNGHPVRDILHVDDFSRACQAFIDSSHVYGLYNLGGGKENSATPD